MIYHFKNQEKITVEELKEKNLFYNEVLIKKEKETAVWIMMAPPNMTGIVHLGHVWDLLIPDFYSRYYHLKNKKVLFIPGKDHAGIATQVKVEKQLKKEIKNLQNMSISEKIKRAKAWVLFYGKQAETVWSMFAISCNQNYLTYTLDEKVKKIITSIFVDYFNQGLIYRSNRIVNWDTLLQTAISDEEVIRKKEKATLYYVKYPIVDSKEHVVVATTRPETIFSDVCLFVNPINKTIPKNLIVYNPLNNEKLKIFRDNYVDKTFGSGVLKCTPQHDINDYKLYKKHNLALGKSSIDHNGIMTKRALWCYGLSINEARKKVHAYLKERNLLEKTEKIEIERAYSARSEAKVEPLISKQWFFKVSVFCKEAFSNFIKKAKFEPSHFSTKLVKWGETLEDWCISRQLWWGLRMPIYYKKDSGYKAFNSKPKDADWKQIDDVLDTWFTSGHWPLILNKLYSEKKQKPFYLVGMGTDIFFAWAIRMILTQYIQKKQIPFDKCLFHGLLRDASGRKMSKSFDNGVDPIKEAKNESADAIRWALLSRNNYGHDINYLKNMLTEAHALIKKITSIISFLEIKIKKSKRINNPNSDNDFKLFFNSLVFNIHKLYKDCDDLVTKDKLNLYCLKVRKFIFTNLSSNHIMLLTNSSFSKSQYWKILELLHACLRIIEPIIPLFSWYLNKYFAKTFEIKYKNNKNYKWTFSFLSDNNFDHLMHDFNMLNLAFMLKAEIRKLSKRNVKNFFIKESVFNNSPMIKKFLMIQELKITDDTNYRKKVIWFSKLKATLIWQYSDKDSLFMKKEITKIKFEIKRADELLKNKKFINNAPAHLIKKEKQKLSYYKKQLQQLKN